MLHNDIVTMSIDADIALPLKTKLHYTAKNAMSIILFCNAMYHMVGSIMIKPFATIYNIISGLRRRKKSKISYNLRRFENHISSSSFDIRN